MRKRLGRNRADIASDIQIANPVEIRDTIGRHFLRQALRPFVGSAVVGNFVWTRLRHQQVGARLGAGNDQLLPVERPLGKALRKPAVEFRRRVQAVPPICAVRVVAQAQVGAGLPVDFRHLVDLVVDFMICLAHCIPPASRAVSVDRGLEGCRRLDNADASIATRVFTHHRDGCGRTSPKSDKDNGVRIDR